MLGNLAHPGYALRTAFDGVQAIADWLFARDVRCCAENSGEKPRGLARSIAVFASAQPKARHSRLWVDIDKAPVHFAAGRAVAQCVNGLFKRRIGQHRSVDQECVLGGSSRELLRQYPFQKRVAPAPFNRAAL
jgi:hypothetical protein